jgi:hypothetical protein
VVQSPSSSPGLPALLSLPTRQVYMYPSINYVQATMQRRVGGFLQPVHLLLPGWSSRFASYPKIWGEGQGIEAARRRAKGT